MGIVAKQHRHSDGHKNKSRAIAFSSLLDKFDAKDVDDVVATEIAQIHHAVKHNLSDNSLDCTWPQVEKLANGMACILCGRH